MKTEDTARLDRPEMTFYKNTYKNSPKWNGKRLGKKKIIIYCEQGIGDTIQFIRYINYIGGHIIVACDPRLHSLIKTMPAVREVIDKYDGNLPPHDCHILSLSLPFVLDKVVCAVPYLSVEPFPDIPDGFKIGISWEGNPSYEHNLTRSCPLAKFKCLKDTLYMLQDKLYTPEFIAGCEEMDLSGYPLNDFMDTARLIASMDRVISVDTSVLHLAGALGKKAYGILSHHYDERWNVYKWYPSVLLIRQDSPGDWDSVFTKLLLLQEKGKF